MLTRFTKRRLTAPTKDVKSSPLFLPPEIVAQIVKYTLEDEDDWITLYRTTPRWRQEKFEAEIEAFILRQTRLECVRLASVSTVFLAEVLFNLRKAMSQQRKQIAFIRGIDKKDERVLRFLAEEGEMLQEVSWRLQRVRDGVAVIAKPRFDLNTKLRGIVRRMRGVRVQDQESFCPIST